MQSHALLGGILMAQIRYPFADCEEALQRGGCCPVGTVSPDFISLQNKLFVEPSPLYWLLLSSSPNVRTCRQSFLLLSKSSWQCTSNLKLPTLFKGKMWISFSTSWLIFTLQLFSFLSFFLFFVGIAKNFPSAAVVIQAATSVTHKQMKHCSAAVPLISCWR